MFNPKQSAEKIAELRYVWELTPDAYLTIAKLKSINKSQAFFIDAKCQ